MKKRPFARQMKKTKGKHWYLSGGPIDSEEKDKKHPWKADSKTSNKKREASSNEDEDEDEPCLKTNQEKVKL